MHPVVRSTQASQCSVPMYTHCRQFPHFKDSSDSEIRLAVVTALTKRPHLRRVMRARNIVIVAAIALAVYILNDGTTSGLGFALILSGGFATVVILLSNFVWVN